MKCPEPECENGWVVCDDCDGFGSYEGSIEDPEVCDLCLGIGEIECAVCCGTGETEDNGIHRSP